MKTRFILSALLIIILGIAATGYFFQEKIFGKFGYVPANLTTSPKEQVTDSVKVIRPTSFVESNKINFGSILENPVATKVFAVNSGLLEEVFIINGQQVKKGQQLFMIRILGIKNQDSTQISRRCSLTALADGTVDGLEVLPGTLVDGNDLLCQLINQSKAAFKINFPDNLLLINESQPVVRFRSEASFDKVYNGIIGHKERQSNGAMVYQVIPVNFPTSELPLRVYGEIQFGELVSFWVSTSCVSVSDKVIKCFRNGKFENVAVEVLENSGGRLRIKGDILSNELIALNPTNLTTKKGVTQIPYF